MLYTSKEIIFHKSHLLLYTRVPKSAHGTPGHRRARGRGEPASKQSSVASTRRCYPCQATPKAHKEQHASCSEPGVALCVPSEEQEAKQSTPKADMWFSMPFSYDADCQQGEGESQLQLHWECRTKISLALALIICGRGQG